MSEIDWALAPEGAVKLRLGRVDSICRWFNANGEAFGSDGWFAPTIEYKTIATRPQQKTVADAYEAFDGKWPDSKYSYAWWDCYTEKVLLGCNETGATICTREQFEAYAKEQETKQEGKKWTHVVNYGFGEQAQCRIISECGVFLWVQVDGVGCPATYKKSELKPIKPALTKAEAWDRCIEEFGVRNIKYVMQELMDEFEIT